MKMNELEILKILNNLQKSSHFLNVQIELWHEGQEKEKFKSQKESVDQELAHVTQQILEIPDKLYSQLAKQGMIDQLRAYINQIRTDIPSLMLSRSQSTILKNELLGLLARDLENQVTGRIFGIRIPLDLYYTSILEEGVNINEFITFLNDEINNIRNITDVNFINLQNYFRDFQSRISEKFAI